MRIALLGVDETSLQVARAIANSRQHELVCVVEAGEHSQPLVELVPSVKLSDSWETLIELSGIEAVVVAPAKGENDREEPLRKLLQAEMPLLVIHPGCDVMLAYELEMIRRDTGNVLIPYSPNWWHPGWTRLLEWVRKMEEQGEPVEQLVFERRLNDRSRENVLRQFARDVWPMRRLVGAVTSINAVGGADAEVSLGNLSVHGATEDGRSIRWSVIPSAVDHSSNVTIVTRSSAATLHVPDDTGEWRFESRGHQTAAETIPIWDEGTAVLRELSRAVEGEPVEPTWSDACLDLEALDGAKRSLRRKRSVDLHVAEASEDQTFKGFMAAAGCLILTIILLGFVCLGVFEGISMPLQEADASRPGAEPADRWPLLVRLWPVYPLVAFLLLQFLLLLAKRGKKD